MPKLELMTKDLDVETKKRVFDFMMFCDDLESLISHENMTLLDKGTVAFDGIYARKINMLNKFEKDIRDVLLLVKKHAPENIDLHKMLVDRIQGVRRVLSINTTFQLRDLKNRTKRMAMLKDTLIDFSKHSDKEGVACH